MNSKTAGKFRSAESPTPLVIAVSLATLFASSTALAADPELEISGQINAAMLFGGDIADPEIVDNNASGTRLRLRGSRDAFGSQRALLRYEFQAQENSSSGAVDGSESFDTRFAEVGLRGGWGSLSLGKGEGATDGTA